MEKLEKEFELLLKNSRNADLISKYCELKLAMLGMMENAVKINDELERRLNDLTSEKDLRVCEVIASAFFKVTFSYKQGNPRGGIPYWKEEVKVYEASNENELNTKINVFLSNDNCGYQKHKKIVDVCKL